MNTMTEDISFTIEGHVATLLLNRPQKLNAVTPEMSSAIISAAKECNTNDQVRCVLVTGAGPKSFCAGSDIRELDTYDTPWNFRNRPDYCDAIRHMLKPTIAAVNGYAFGGGLETSLSCDIRIAATNAQFAAPEIKLGWIGGGGMAAFLSQSIGPSNAALMIMTGDPINAETALTWGLVSEVLPPERLLDRAREIAAIIASRAPIAAETAKLNLRASVSMPQEKAIEYERDLQTICFATQDAAEGRAAFKEKRAPLFQRR
ncbi:MAG: enoyl-CoA hydratase/isomerase family protein [Acidobacteriaceae bacterium]|jgi:enoyl-CoA hydratase/carnithine racemase